MNRISLALHPCPACNDTGYLKTQNRIERCDECERFPDDLRAAIAYLEAHHEFVLDAVTVRPTLES